MLFPFDGRGLIDRQATKELRREKYGAQSILDETVQCIAYWGTIAIKRGRVYQASALARGLFENDHGHESHS